ncbi:MAG TPA: alpha/beta hydrolase [Candidatus Udaeobacter sp.]|nr:alpha/beta hydrolase [Candidatus Udaeobacter sp.]
MKQQILFIQGGGEGAYQEDGLLVASLRNALGDAYEVRYPKMPRKSDPDYRRWKTQIRKELTAMKERLIAIGHSLGGSFLLRYLSEEKTDATIAGLFLIATPYWGGDGWRYDGYEAVTLREDFASRLPRGAPIFLYHGVDDEVVPFSHLALYEEKLPQAVTRAHRGRGHQLSNDLSEVAEDIKSLE